MTHAKKNIDQLFQIEKSSKTELTLQQVEAFIVQLPNLPAPNPNNNFEQFLTLKNILMITIPSLIAIAAVTLSLQTADTKTSASNTSIENIIPYEIRLENNTDVVSPYETANTENAATNHSITQTTKSQSPSSMKTNERKDSMETNFQVQPSAKEESQVVPTQKQTRNINSSNSHVITPPSNHKDQNLTSREARKLKRKLYKNLVADGLIPSKYSHVEMELKGTSIILNGTQIPYDLLPKYQNLTHKAGSGANRKIILTSDYIRVGDFTKEGFRGIGVGKFQNEPSTIGKNNLNSVQSTKKEIDVIPTTNKEDELNLLIDAEISELHKYVNNLYKDKIENGKRSWFNGSKKLDKDLRLIHTKLYDLLQKDELIADKHEFVVLELKEDEILFNGKTLQSSTSTPITALINEYKIQRKPNRLIMMSHHSIAVVDHRYKSFTGTFLEIR